MQPSLLDETTLETLAMLADEDEPEFLQNTLRLFETDMQGLLKEIEKAISNEDLAFLRACAHKAKGMCLNVGAKSLAEAMLGLENAAKEGRRYADLKPLGFNSNQLFKETREAMAAWVSANPAEN